MEMPTIVKVLLVCAAVLALGAVLIGCAFLKSSPPQTGVGFIRSKTGVGGGTYWQQSGGAQRGFRTATPVSIAPSYVFEIELEGIPARARYSLNPSAAEKFEVGQKVRVEYLVRGTRLLWSRIYLTKMEPAQ